MHFVPAPYTVWLSLMLRSLLLYLSEHESAKKVLTQHLVGRRLAARFIAGEGVDEALAVVRRLEGEGFRVTLDYLGESVQETAQAEAACQVYLNLLDRLAAENLKSHVSIKLTQLGLAFDEALARQHLRALAEGAAAHHNFVRVDMEGSAFTESTLRVFRAIDAPRQVVGVVLQAYLHRTEADVDELLKYGARIRLVKGAYKEPPDIAFPRKQEVDQNFLKLMPKLLASGGFHAIATHDDHLNAATVQFARQRGIPPDRFEFQLLHGIRRQLQRDLLKQGWGVRVYVPYGRDWYAYFMRRLAERPANLLFLLRHLFRA